MTNLISFKSVCAFLCFTLMINLSCTQKEDFEPVYYDPSSLESSFSKQLNDVGTLMRMNNINFRDISSVYNIGREVVLRNYATNELRSDEIFHRAFTLNDKVWKSNSRESDDLTLSVGIPDTVDFSGLELPIEAQNLLVELYRSSFDLTLDEFIDSLDEKINSAGYEIVLGDGSFSLDIAVVSKELAKFIYANSDILLEDFDPSARMSCATFIGGMTVTGAILGGAIGFLVGSVVPGPGNAAGAWGGAEAGGFLGAALGGAAAAVGSKAICDNEEQKMNDSDGFSSDDVETWNSSNINPNIFLPPGYFRFGSSTRSIFQ